MQPSELKDLRKRLDLSQVALSDLLGLSFATINRWEQGSFSPRGAALILLRALDSSSRAQPGMASKISKWADQGESAFWARVFAQALVHERVAINDQK